ncbi:MAG: thiamine pyrophosphate-dependent enzyme [Desulfobacterales bacterium]|nr:thiamine pyrophosphate-dependent enzyme [Desulfobacterales bacterium]
MIILSDAMLGQMMEPVDRPQALRGRQHRKRHWAVRRQGDRPRKVIKVAPHTDEELIAWNRELKTKYERMDRARAAPRGRSSGRCPSRGAWPSAASARICTGRRAARSGRRGCAVGPLPAHLALSLPGAGAAGAGASRASRRLLVRGDANNGQMVEDVRLAACGEAEIRALRHSAGGHIFSPDEIYRRDRSGSSPGAWRLTYAGHAKIVYQSRDAHDRRPVPTTARAARTATIHRLVAEVMDELDIAGRAIGVDLRPAARSAPSDHFDCDMVMALHGRGPAVATGIKRARPGAVVFTYQGDGDLAAIGTGEIVHAANRGETHHGGLRQQRRVRRHRRAAWRPPRSSAKPTTSYPAGRDAEGERLPAADGRDALRHCRASPTSPACIRTRRGAHPQNEESHPQGLRDTRSTGRGFGMVEILAACPTNWRLSPVRRMETHPDPR